MYKGALRLAVLPTDFCLRRLWHMAGGSWLARGYICKLDLKSFDRVLRFDTHVFEAFAACVQRVRSRCQESSGRRGIFAFSVEWVLKLLVHEQPDFEHHPPAKDQKSAQNTSDDWLACTTRLIDMTWPPV